MQKEDIVRNLNNKNIFVRIYNLSRIKKTLFDETNFDESKINLQSVYSFSPYYPIMAVYQAVKSGAKTVGLTDYVSLMGSWEFRYACKKLGLFYVTGARLPVSIDGEIYYASLYGIPKSRVEYVDYALLSQRKIQYNYTKLLTDKLNGIFSKHGIKLKYDKDVMKKSSYRQGGSVFDKHVYFALSKKITEKYPKGVDVAEFLIDELKLKLTESDIKLLSSPTNPHYDYDLSRILRLTLKVGEKFNCYTVEEALLLAKSNDCLLALESRDASFTKIKAVANLCVKVGADALGFDASKLSTENCDKTIKYLFEKGLLAVNLDVLDEPRKYNGTNPKSEYSAKSFELCVRAITGHEISVCVRRGFGLNSDKVKKDVVDFEQRLNLFANIASRIIK